MKKVESIVLIRKEPAFRMRDHTAENGLGFVRFGQLIFGSVHSSCDWHDLLDAPIPIRDHNLYLSYYAVYPINRNYPIVRTSVDVHPVYTTAYMWRDEGRLRPPWCILTAYRSDSDREMPKEHFVCMFNQQSERDTFILSCDALPELVHDAI